MKEARSSSGGGYEDWTTLRILELANEAFAAAVSLEDNEMAMFAAMLAVNAGDHLQMPTDYVEHLHREMVDEFRRDKEAFRTRRMGYSLAPPRSVPAPRRRQALP